jgi:GT2 family glycosyltransferase
MQLLRYLLVGRDEEADPNPLFSSSFYRACNSDMRGVHESDLAHYVRAGALQGRWPNPLFDHQYYVTRIPELRHHPERALFHYFENGSRLGLSPCRLFDSAYYLRSNADVASSKVDPFVHFLVTGGLEGRNPHALFRSSFYLERNPDAVKRNPLVHYLEHGREHGRDPNELFVTSFYLAQNTDLRVSAENPLVHYLRNGVKRGCDTHPLFSTRYYVRRYPDVRGSSAPPVEHCLERARAERRDPHPLFSTSHYLDECREARESHLHPVQHYYEEGARQRCDPSPLFSVSLYSEEHPDMDGNHLEHFIAHEFREPTESGIPGFVYRSWRRRYARSRLEKAPEAAAPHIALVTRVDAVTWEEVGGLIHSLRLQGHSRWLLYIEVAGSCASGVPAIAEEDPRIRVSVVSLEVALGSSALEDDWIIRIGPNDRLEPHALACLGEAAEHHPQASVLYSDEDQLDRGLLEEPHLKPDWNRHLFYGWNYLGGLLAVRRSAVEGIGKAAADDYDLLLRILEVEGDGAFVHIPGVLCHRRAEPETDDRRARMRSLAAHFERTGVAAEVLPLGSKHQRVVFSLPEERPLVTLIVPTRDGLALLRRCLESLLDKTTYSPFEILIVDNGSVERETLGYLADPPRECRVVSRPGPFNYSAINNFAAVEARGSILAFLNNDVEIVDGDWLTEMVRLAVRPDIGVVGAKLLFPDETVQHAGVVVGMHGSARHAFEGLGRHDPGHFGRAILTHEVSAVTAACMLVRREVFERVRGFDEVVFPIDFSDTDLCLRIGEIGYRVVFTPHAELIHHESATRGRLADPDEAHRVIRAFQERWRSKVERDPFYNPNLSLDNDTFSLACPPR